MSLWTEERVDETVTSAYVHSHLRPNEQELLQRPLYFGGDLTDDTYLDWILTRAKRFFLILVTTGVPDQIFGVIDDSYDDEDLPIIEEAVPALRLSYEPDRSLENRFYKTQFRFLTRVVGEGEHIRYADEEIVPIIPLNLKSVILSLSHEGIDRVRLPSANQKIFIRRRMKLDALLSEEEILNEIAASRRLCHEHVVSVFGSYLYQGNFNVLSLPAPEWSLKTFLIDTPKSFGALSKKERRQILINWPHCLASALTWLHNNGEFHGAIRPSNIQIDESFRISLGLLDGNGLLRNKARPDDIEAYQYGPPERWKRAVTIQSTGSAAVSLPSGGRSRRRIGGSGRMNSADGNNSVRTRSASSATTYTFQAMSKGNCTRLRLSTALGPDDPSPPHPFTRDYDILSTTDTKSISSQGTARLALDSIILGRASSFPSSTSSDGKKNSPLLNSPIFVSAPEGRSAVVQTWQSVEQDMFASDIFSLGAVIIDILSFLCKRSYGSFQRHRSAKNRMAGRGGGLADASFHANLGQVFLWVQSLQNEAEKKAKKDEGQTYHAVGPVAQLTLQCLERDPSARLSSGQLEKKIGEHIQRFAGIERLHCAAEQRKESRDRSVNIPVLERNSSDQDLARLRSEKGQRQSSPDPQAVAADHHRQLQLQHILQGIPILQSPVIHTPPSAISTPGTTSASSLLSFNFDGLSDTVVADSSHSREQSPRRMARRREEVGTPEYQGPWPSEQDTPRQKHWTDWHNNDNQVDPRHSFVESIETGAFTYLNYSTSVSSDEGVKYFPRPPSDPPTKPPPNRGLPPVPSVPTLPANTAKMRSTNSKHLVSPLKTSNDEMAILNHLSNAATGGVQFALTVWRSP